MRETMLQNYPLHLAAYRNDTDRIESLIEQGHDINARDLQGMTPLANAASAPEAARLLLNYGADPNLASLDNRSPLFLAVWQNCEPVVDRLLHMCANPDIRSADEGMTPLHVAAMYGHAHYVRKLLAHGANPEIRDAEGKTARDLAVEYEQPETSQILDPVTAVPPMSPEKLKAAREKGKKQSDAIKRVVAKI